MFSLETAGLPQPAKIPKAVMFDFDGTVSTLREGWHGILTKYFVKMLKNTPLGKAEDENNLVQLVLHSIEGNIGMLPVFQFYTLIELLKQYQCGEIHPAEFYLKDYYRDLFALVERRHQQLRDGQNPDELMLPGTVKCLKMFQKFGVKLYLVSGTEQEFIRQDCELLKITSYFNGGIFGGTEDIAASAKKSIIARIIGENGIEGCELVSFGDGQTETKEVKAAGGFSVGVASNEDTRDGINEWKRQQLIETGADWIIPHFEGVDEIEQRIFG